MINWCLCSCLMNQWQNISAYICMLAVFSISSNLFLYCFTKAILFWSGFELKTAPHCREFEKRWSRMALVMLQFFISEMRQKQTRGMIFTQFRTTYKGSTVAPKFSLYTSLFGFLCKVIRTTTDLAMVWLMFGWEQGGKPRVFQEKVGWDFFL